MPDRRRVPRSWGKALITLIAVPFLSLIAAALIMDQFKSWATVPRVAAQWAVLLAWLTATVIFVGTYLRPRYVDVCSQCGATTDPAFRVCRNCKRVK